MSHRLMNSARSRMEKVLLCIIAALALCVAASLAGRQYHFLYEPKNWTEARSYCRDTYTDLVSVDSVKVVNILNSLVVKTQLGSTLDAWTGLYFDVISWTWSLSDIEFYSNSSKDFRNWAPGEPTSDWFEGECGFMYDNGLWNDAPCEWTYQPVCSKTSGTNVTFVVVNKLMSWPQAQNYCREHYTDLASVRSASENEKIRTLKPAGAIVWIGLYKDTWKWSDGPMYVYRYWSRTPIGGMYKCMAANFGYPGYWVDCLCDVKKPFICHHDPVPFSKHTVRVKLVKDSPLDLTDPAALQNLLTKLQQKMKDQGVTADLKLSWNEQPNGNVFFQDKKNQK